MKTESPTPEQPTTCLVMFSIVVALFAATIIHALPLTSQIVIVTTIFVIAFLWIVRRVYRQDEERFNAQMNNLTSAQETSNTPKEGVR